MSLRLKRYAEYKQSPVPWLGKIPSGWRTLPAFSVFRERQEKNVGLREKQVLSLSYGRIIKKHEDALHGLVPASFETYQIVEPGNIILRLTDLQNDQRSWRVGLAKDRGIITSAYACLRVCDGLLPEYAYFLLHAADVQKAFYGMGSGLRQSLGFDDLRRMPIAVPSIEEQIAIVRYLQVTGGRTDRLIRAKRRVIELLSEQKQTIIDSLVVHGFYGNPDLKPCLLAWLPNIPITWSAKRNSQLFRERNEPGADGLPNLVVSLRTGVTVGGDLDEDRRPRKLIAKASGYKRAQPGDIAYNMMRMWQGAVGVVPVEGLVSPAYVVARPLDNVCSKYFELLYRTTAYKNEVNRNSRGIVSDRNRLYWDDFKRMESPVPPLDEQIAIVEHIKRETATADTAAAKAQREIELLREYRTRLIVDVVTGKLDVRSNQLPEIDSAEEIDALTDNEDAEQEANEVLVGAEEVEDVAD